MILEQALIVLVAILVTSIIELIIHKLDNVYAKLVILTMDNLFVINAIILGKFKIKYNNLIMHIV